MDFQTSVFALGIVFVAAFIVYFSSVLAMKEKTYEEALEEQRRSHNPLFDDDKSSSSSSHHKKSKKKRRKERDVTSAVAVQQTPTTTTSEDNAETTPEEVILNGVTPTINDEIGDDMDDIFNVGVLKTRAKRHVVEEVEVGEEEEEEEDASNDDLQAIGEDVNEEDADQAEDDQDNAHVNGVDDEDDKGEEENSVNEPQEVKPVVVPEPIVVKQEVVAVTAKKEYNGKMNHEVTANVNGYNKAKQHEKQQQQQQQQQQKPEGKNKNQEKVNNHNHKSTTVVVKATETKQQDAPEYTVSSFDTSNNILALVDNDISLTGIVELIKSVPLSNDEIQIIIDSLLDLHGDGGGDWIKKNNPVATLKRQLADRENELKIEVENHERTKARVSTLRDEIKAEKGRYNTYKDQLQAQQQKLQSVQQKLQALEHQRSVEIANLQGKLSQIECKLSQERNDAIAQLTEEQSRLADALQQLEQEKTAQNVLNFQLMQLKSERQQFDGVNCTLEQEKNDLQAEVVMLRDKIEQLTADIKANDVSYSNKLLASEEQYKKLVAEAEAHAGASVTQVKRSEADLEKLKADLNAASALLEAANQKVKCTSDAAAAKEAEMAKVFEVLSKVNFDASRDNLAGSLEQLIAEYRSLQETAARDSSESADRLSSLEKQLCEEKKNAAELQEKLSRYELTLSKAAHDLSHIGSVSEDELSNISARKERTDTEYKSLADKSDKLNCSNSNEINVEL